MQLHEMPELAAKLAGALEDDPPLALKEGGIFRDGFDRDLDELRQASREGKNWIARTAGTRDRRAPGSSRSRSVSIPCSVISSRSRNRIWRTCPAHYTRKQTTVGGERFITPELKEMEAKILGADERARQLEYQLFQTLREETLRELGADPADGGGARAPSM